MKYIIAPALLLLLLSCTDTKKEKNVSYAAGFKIIRTVDNSRIYRPKTDTTDYLHYRPLDIDIWYPSKVNEKDSVLLFRDILVLLEKRAIYYTASQEWHGVTRQIAQSFCDGFKCSDSTKLLNFKTRSFRDAPPVDKKFPLVIYICAYNGMSYENFTLLEELAKRGFVVISINSIGRFPGDMTMKKEDLFEQVNDALASFKALNRSSNIDFSKIGIIGYSWGGLSASLVARNIPDVACLISFDGSEYHHYGEDSEEDDSDFNNIRYSPEFKNLKLSIPYLRLESSPGVESSKVDSIYNFSEKLSGEKQIFEIDSAKHEDFSCLSVVVRESGNCLSNQRYNTIVKLTLSFLEDHLKNTNTFAQTIDQEINKTIKKRKYFSQAE
jgi:hypothetical protein